MSVPIVIVETHPEMAAAFEDVIAFANFTPIVISHVDGLADIVVPPAAIVVRIDLDAPTPSPHTGLEQLPAGRPPVVAIAWTDEEVAEANRLGCEVVLRAPDEVKRLCAALTELAN